MNGIAHRFIFVGGMHRSGTTPLARLIGSHPSVSMFAATGFPEDEGQYLQDIYPKERDLGGVGRFGHHKDAHLDETSALIERAKSGLFDAWAAHWDLNCPYLLEKTPINFIRGRFLQEVFANSYFIFIVRHPVATCLATMKWANKISFTGLLEHWIKCHEYMLEDQPHLRRCLILRYEDVCDDVATTATRVRELLEIETGFDHQNLGPGYNDLYFSQWKAGDYRIWAPERRLYAWVKRNLWNRAEIAYLETRFERAINRFGYSFADLSTTSAPRRAGQLGR